MATPIPSNDARFTLAELALACDGQLAGEDFGRATAGVRTDSRTLRPGELFVALVGDRFDGHDHVGSAFERGAGAALVSRAVPAAVGPQIVVPDTLRALGSLARAHRRRVAAAREPSRPLRLVGITGSAGKTTTRHAVVDLLRALGYAVHSSAGNLNNAVGVPMTLLGLSPQHEIAVVEMGMNAPGEIAYLAGLCEPDVGVVTLVAHAHTEGVGSLLGVAREKVDLLRHVVASGTAIANLDSPGAAAGLLVAGPLRRLGYGEAAGSFVRLAARRPTAALGAEIDLVVDGRTLTARTALLGQAGALATAAAVAIAVGLDPALAGDGERLVAAISAIGAGEPGRLSATPAPRDNLVIDDAYNANPASMRSSIEAAAELAQVTGKRLVLILGAMRELGAASPELHGEVGRAAAGAKPALLCCVDPEAEPIAEQAERAGTAAARARTAELVVELLRERPITGSVVLIKGSNSIRLGRVAAYLHEDP